MRSDTPPTLQRLDSGYWFVRWSHNIWAQWPCDRDVRKDDFSHELAYSFERARQCDRLTGQPERGL
jgi:hypothetical protein